jgi:histidine triad (HIT) family protein
VFSRVRQISAALPAALGSQGTFVALNNVVSQSVPHLHVHVVPRTRGDGLRGFFWPRQKYASEAEAEAVAGRIRDALAGPGS